MARIAKKTEAATLIGSGRGRPRKYPWPKWADGRIWIAVKNEDFTIEPLTFSIAVHAYARNHGMKAKTSVKGDMVTFMITEGV